MRDGTVLDRSGRRYRPATIRSYAHGLSSSRIRDKLDPLRVVYRRAIQERIVRISGLGLNRFAVVSDLDLLSGR